MIPLLIQLHILVFFHREYNQSDTLQPVQAKKLDAWPPSLLQVLSGKGGLAPHFSSQLCCISSRCCCSCLSSQLLLQTALCPSIAWP